LRKRNVSRKALLDQETFPGKCFWRQERCLPNVLWDNGCSAGSAFHNWQCPDNVCEVRNVSRKTFPGPRKISQQMFPGKGTFPGKHSWTKKHFLENVVGDRNVSRKTFLDQETFPGKCFEKRKTFPGRHA
jgi:hypothetical protein